MKALVLAAALGGLGISSIACAAPIVLFDGTVTRTSAPPRPWELIPLWEIQTADLAAAC